MKTKRFAEILSILLGPVWLPVLLCFVIFGAELTFKQIIILLPTLFILLVIIPIGYLVIGPKFGWIKNWEMKKREERIPFLTLILINAVISLIAICIWGNVLLLKLSITLIILLIILLVISRYWKISIHSSLNTISIILLNFIFDWKLLYLILSIPLIYWARLRLKRHNNKQLIAGIVFSAIITFIGIFSIVKF